MSAPNIVFRGRKFVVEQRPVKTRDGETHQHDFIAHPGAAVVLPVLDDGRIVLIRCHRPAVNSSLLELPAGTIDHVDGQPEPPENCAARELAEETGYRAGNITHIVSFYSSPGICTEQLHAFVAEGLTPGETNLEPTEEIENVPMTFGEALAKIASHDITDGKTIVTLLYYSQFCLNQE